QAVASDHERRAVAVTSRRRFSYSPRRPAVNGRPEETSTVNRAEGTRQPLASVVFSQVHPAWFCRPAIHGRLLPRRGRHEPSPFFSAPRSTATATKLTLSTPHHHQHFFSCASSHEKPK